MNIERKECKKEEREGGMRGVMNVRRKERGNR